MTYRGSQRAKEFVESTTAVAARLMVGAGLAPDVAAELAVQLARELCSLYGREKLYIPADLDFKRQERDLAIWTKYGQRGPSAGPYTAHRVAELAAEYDLTETQVRNITRLYQQRQVADRQGTLPGLDPADS